MSRKIVIVEGGGLGTIAPAVLRPTLERWIVVTPASRLYPLHQPPVIGTEIVSLNGLILDLDEDYTISGMSLVIAADVPMSPGDKLAIRYWRSV